MGKRRKNRKHRKMQRVFLAFIVFIGICIGIYYNNPDISLSNYFNIDVDEIIANVTDTIENINIADTEDDGDTESTAETTLSFSLDDIPEFDGTSAYVIINDNIPDFDESEYTTESFEIYSELDSLGRCGVAYANICQEIMPTEERGEIGSIKPTGWHTVKYDIVDGKYLYNRCHLIGYQLAGENANEKNLITGTRYLNVEGMLDFENEVADYVEETDNHVLYRVTPIFEGDNLLASGVQIEAYSVEDSGEGICFNVYCYNAQPGVTINYETGDSELS